MPTYEQSHAEWINKLQPTVGPCGPIQSLRRFYKRSIDYPVYIYGCTLINDSFGTVAEASDRMSACGVAFSSNQALASALGEACERYAFSICPLSGDNISSSSVARIKKELISELPFLFSQYARSINDIAQALEAENQWAFFKRWTANGTDSSDKISIPLAALFADYSTEAIPASTSGMAAGPTFEFALHRAICELVERDAFMCAWFYRYPGKKVDSSSLFSEEIKNWIQRLRLCNVDFRIHDISSDLTPFHVFLGYVTRLDGGKPVSFSCGAGCSLDPLEAARRAFLEATLSWRGSDELLTLRGALTDENLRCFKPESFTDHSYFYQHSGAMHAVSHLIQQKEVACKYDRSTEMRTEDEKLGVAVKTLADNGFKVYVLDVTPGEFGGMGLYVVRAIIPGLVPLAWGQYQPFRTKRFLMPTWIPSEFRKDELNPSIHPFP